MIDIIQIFRKIYNDSLIKNSIYLIATNISNLMVGFIYWIIVARYYSQQDIGTISVILSAVYLISMICTLGFPIALIYYLPRDPRNANRMINSCLIIGIAATIILSLISISSTEIWAPDLKPFIGLAYIILFTILSTVETISNIMMGAFMAGKKSSFHMIKTVFFNISKILPIVIFSTFGAMGILLSWTIGDIVSIIIGFYLLNRLWKYSPIFSVDPMVKNMLTFSTGNYMATIVGYIPRSVLPIIIVNLVSVEAAGYFFIAMTIASILNTIPIFISGTLLAESSEEDKLWVNVSKAVRFNTFILLPGLILFMIFGKTVLNLFNPAYAEYALSTLMILSIASIPLSLNSIFNAVRNSQRKVMSVIKNNIGVAIITVPLSIPLINNSGIQGAAIAYLIANIIVAMIILKNIKNPIKFTIKLLRYNV